MSKHIVKVVFFAMIWLCIAQDGFTKDSLVMDKMIVIEGYCYTNNTLDTIQLDIHSNKGRQYYELIDTTLLFISKNGKFKFVIPSNSEDPVFISLSCSGKKYKRNNILFNKLLIHFAPMFAGDSIQLTYSDNQIYIQGNHAKHRLELWRDLKKISEEISYSLKPDSFVSSKEDAFKGDFLMKDSIFAAQIAFLLSRKKLISDLEFKLFQAELIADRMSYLSRRMGIGYFGAIAPEKRRFELEYYKAHVQNKIRIPELFDAAIYSGSYAFSLYLLIALEDMYKAIEAGVKDYDRIAAPLGFLPQITSTYNGILKDKLILIWIETILARNILSDALLDEAISNVEDRGVMSSLMAIKMSLGKGAKLVHHDFVDAKGNKVNLSKYKGKVLLIDFWFTGCSGCVIVAEKLRNVESAFPDRDKIEFLSISIDKDRNQWLGSILPEGRAYITGEKYTHYVTDKTIYLNTGGSGTDNQFIKTYVSGMIYPTLLIIDADQRIYSSNPPKPYTAEGAEELIKVLRNAIGE